MARANFTASIVILSQIALSQTARWRELVPQEALAFYRTAIAQLAAADPLIRRLSLIPAATALWMLDKAVVYGYGPHIALRKRAIESQLRLHISEGARQVVVVGAGFDTLALRLCPEFPNVQFYELDLPDTQAMKRQIVQECGVVGAANLHFVPCDLSQMSLDTVLARTGGFDAASSSVFIAEGVCMYLAREQNLEWLRAARRAVSASPLHVILTLMEPARPRSAVGALMVALTQGRRKERYLFALNAEDVPAFLSEVAFTLDRITSFSGLQTPWRSAQEILEIEADSGEYLVFCHAH